MSRRSRNRTPRPTLVCDKCGMEGAGGKVGAKHRSCGGSPNAKPKAPDSRLAGYKRGTWQLPPKPEKA